MTEPNLTGYMFWLAGAVLIGAVIFLLGGKKNAGRWMVPELLLSVLLGLVCGRLVFILVRIRWFLSENLLNMLWPSDPMNAYWGSGAHGMALFGTMGGTVLACWLLGRKSRSTGKILDAMAPAAALAIALGRIGEFLIGEGIGFYVEEESLWFLPVALVDEWGGAVYAVFLWEAIAALIIFLVLVTFGRKLENGYRARLFLILFCSSQIVLEALRMDNCLTWQYLHVSELFAAAFLLAMMIAARVRKSAAPGRVPLSKGEAVLCFTVFVLLAGAAIALEFDAAGKLNMFARPIDFLLEALCCAGFGIAAFRVVFGRKK